MRDEAPAAARKLRVICLNTNYWEDRRTNWRPGEEPDPLAVERRLEAYGIVMQSIDPGRFPLNPLAGSQPMIEAIDPLRALRVLLRERRADLIVATNEGPAFLPLLLGGLAGFRVPILIHDPILGDNWRLRNRVLDTIIRKAAGVLLLSSWQRDYIAERWGRREGVEALGYSIDTDFWRPDPSSPEPLPAKGPILSVGQDHSRDFELLVGAMQGMDGDLVLRTSREIKVDPLPSNVTLLRERVSTIGLRDLYARSRFVVVPLKPTLNAGGINTILEALACGRPMIVSDSPVIRDFLRPEENCLVVPCGDQAAMRAAIARLLAEPDTCARLAANARRYAEEFLGSGPYAARLAAAYQRHARRP